MEKEAFVKILLELGFTEHYVRQILALREREKAAGIRRDWEEYLPHWYQKG